MAEALERREICWRLIDGPTGGLVLCAIYESEDGVVELRVGDQADRIVRSERVADDTMARTRAEQWLAAFRAAGSVYT